MSRRELARRLYDRVRPELDPRIKDAVARRVTQKVALFVLGNRLASWDPVHKNAVRTFCEMEGLPQADFHRLWEELCGVLVTGAVVPLEEVHQAIDEARSCHIGACVCRSSRRVRDLRGADGRVHLLASEPDCQPWMDRLLDAWRPLRCRPHRTNPALARILDDCIASDTRPSRFFEATWPWFEILLDHPRFTGVWLESMTRNDKTWEVDREVLHAWVDLCWYTRGNIFTSMVVVDEPYTICTCPGPEVDGGCLLFNWHHYSGNPYVVKVREARQRRDADGRPLPCAWFPERGNRDCYGCGCQHTMDEKRIPGK